MSVTDILNWAYATMEYPWVLLLIILLVPLLIWLLKKKFAVTKEDLQTQKQKKRVKKVMFFTRTIMFILVLIALASPYTQTEKIIEGDPYIQLLVDNSTSMSLFEDVSKNLALRFISNP